jgi:biopolymer transport protein TolQ
MNEASLLHMVTGSGPVVQAVLFILIALSVWSWAITISKYLQFKKAQAQSDEFTNLFWDSKNLSRIEDSCKRLSASPLVTLFTSGYRELRNAREEAMKSNHNKPSQSQLGSIDMVMKRAAFEESTRLEQGLTFLATVASAAPFIGLFGTVWGIMNAFHGLGTSGQASTIQAVAPGISEALVATAIGLAAAIPAAIAYNFFSVTVRNFRNSMDRFGSEFVNISERYFV